MDQGRQADLKRIQTRLTKDRVQTRTQRRIVVDPETGKKGLEIEQVRVYNDKHDKWARERARNAKSNIVAEQRDPTLRRLRRQLLQAAAAHNTQAELRIEAQIRRYTNQMEKFQNYA